MTTTNLNIVEIQHRDIAIRFMVPSLEDHISKTIAATGTFYEVEMLDALSDSLKPEDLVIDVGANIGNHSLYFSKVLGCQVVAFEAYPPTAELLRKNVAINQVQNLVAVHGFALGSAAGAARVAAFDPANVGSTSFAIDPSGEVRVLPLDKIEMPKQVTLIKIDAEGMDLAVIQGAQGLIAKDRPMVVCEAGTDAEYRSISRYLDAQGYMAAAVFNATDTYLFLPSKTPPERAIALSQCFNQLMLLQRAIRRLGDSQAQASRRSERIQRDLLQQINLRTEELREGAKKNLEARWIVMGSDFKLGLEQTLSQAKQFSQRLQVKAEESAGQKLNEVRNEVAREREVDRAALSEFARIKEEWVRVNSEIRQEIDKLPGQWETVKNIFQAEIYDLRESCARFRSEIAALHQEILVLTGDRDGRVRLHQEKEMDSAQKIIDLQHAVDVERAELSSIKGLASDKERRLKNAHRVLLSKEKEFNEELADKERRIKSAHRVLKVRDSELQILLKRSAQRDEKINRVTRRNAELQQGLDKIQASITFKLGVLMVRVIKSPLQIFLLPVLVPSLMFKEWQIRRSRSADN